MKGSAVFSECGTYRYEPLKCSRLMPWFVKTYEEFLIGKVERVFSMLEDTPSDEPRTV